MLTDSPAAITHETREDFSPTTISLTAPTLLKSARDFPNAAREEFLARIAALAATQSVGDTLDLAALLLVEVGINISSIRLDRCGFVTQWRSPCALNQNEETKTLRVRVGSNTLSTTTTTFRVANNRAARKQRTFGTSLPMKEFEPHALFASRRFQRRADARRSS